MTRYENLLTEATRRICDGESVVMATVVEIRGSSSQPLGARMAVFDDGSFIGSVSGGCVETDVVQRSAAVRDDGRPRLAEYHQVTDPVFEVGLNCDGSIVVLLEVATEEYLGLLKSSTPGIVETVIEGLSAGIEGSPVRVSRRVLGAEVRDAGRPGVISGHPGATQRRGDSLKFREPVGLRSKLLIFGGGDIAVVLSSLAARVGFHVTVSDPRGDFLDLKRLSDAHRVVSAWPAQVLAGQPVDESTFVVSLNHEPRFEDALFKALMDQPRPRYVGAIGKPQRQAEREARQTSSGFDLSRLPRIHTPIGIPIGGKSPEDIAVSILAELMAVRNGR